MAEIQQDQHQHHSHHHHHETPGMSHDDKNRAHWDSVAKTYNSENTQKDFGNLINKAHAFVLSNISSIGIDFLDPSSTFESPTDTDQPSIRILDYACGPGTITSILTGRAVEYIGIDLSPNMVAEYNERFSPDSSETPLNARAYNANLFTPSTSDLDPLLSDPKFFNFDLAAVGFGFHHFEDLPLCTSRLVERLKPGGVLMILDFYSHDKDDMSGHAAHGTVSHHGFSENGIRALFEGAGLTDILVLDFGEDVIMKKTARRRPFMARGRKPLT